MSHAIALRRGKLLKMNQESAEDFAALYQENSSLVRTVIYQVLGHKTSPQQLSDLVQDCFIKIWKSLPEFRNDSELRSWIYRISINTALDYVRSAPARREVFDESFVSGVESDLRTDEQFAQREILSKSLSQLSDEHRVVIVLAIFQELKLDDVAQILSLPIGTVKSRLHYAKEELRDILVQLGVEL